MECVILAGGTGSRLQSVVSDVPKCMAPVAGKPFLYYLISSLKEAGFKHIILSLGYKHEVVEAWFAANPAAVNISFITENEPLGTGGAVKYALTKATQEDVFVLNGDSFFHIDYAGMLRMHKEKETTATLALKEMKNFDRYGVVGINADGYITHFSEKRFCRSGLINGGTYLIAKESLAGFPDKFSLEKDFFEKEVSSGSLVGFESKGYFIDIGIPEDYRQAQIDFKNGAYQKI
ncbi:MAG: nucleotidyltransferase family protein [Tannerellaceae bacterium]|jgi:D-glycero-alpha-D-manno-heptose 1-phosphate guanylyltransferase|nr:nucleotidyltransferase family protein [Tannerellaceae bacterium]